MQSLLEMLRGQQEGRASIFDLPEEILIGIFSYLQTAEDLCALSAVCKALNLIANDDVLWEPLCCPAWDLSRRGYECLPVFPSFVIQEFLEIRQCKTQYMDWLRRASHAFVTQNAYNAENPLIRTQDRATAGYDCLIKLLMVGDAGVGKSCFLIRYSDDTFSGSFIVTIGIDFKIKTITIHDKVVKVKSCLFIYLFIFADILLK